MSYKLRIQKAASTMDFRKNVVGDGPRSPRNKDTSDSMKGRSRRSRITSFTTESIDDIEEEEEEEEEMDLEKAKSIRDSLKEEVEKLEKQTVLDDEKCQTLEDRYEMNLEKFELKFWDTYDIEKKVKKLKAKLKEYEEIENQYFTAKQATEQIGQSLFLIKRQWANNTKKVENIQHMIAKNQENLSKEQDRIGKLKASTSILKEETLVHLYAQTQTQLDPINAVFNVFEDIEFINQKLNTELGFQDILECNIQARVESCKSFIKVANEDTIKLSSEFDACHKSQEKIKSKLLKYEKQIYQFIQSSGNLSDITKYPLPIHLLELKEFEDIDMQNDDLNEIQLHLNTLSESQVKNASSIKHIERIVTEMRKKRIRDIERTKSG